MNNHSLLTKDWQNVGKILLENRKSFRDLLTDDEVRVRIQFFCVFIMFIVLSIAMTIMNIITHWHMLMLITLFFAIVNAVNVVLMLIGPHCELLTRYLFAFEMLALFTSFVIVGEPEGFSAIWLALLPTSGMLLYRLKYGLLLSGIQFIILVFFYWTEFGRSLLLFQYTDSFSARFPILFIAFLCVGAFFEFIRQTTQEELIKMRKNYEDLSKHDPLTGLFNRFGFYAAIEEEIKEETGKGCAVAIIDFDHFKEINDTYGHTLGDAVLKGTAQKMLDIIDGHASACRWGGDEFAIYFNEKANSEELCGKILSAAREQKFNANGKMLSVTVSIGLMTVDPCIKYNLTDIINVADSNLYFSKSSGRNKLIVSNYSPNNTPDNDILTGSCS